MRVTGNWNVPGQRAGGAAMGRALLVKYGSPVPGDVSAKLDLHLSMTHRALGLDVVAEHFEYSAQ